MVHLERLKPASEIACLLAKGTEIVAEPSGHVGVVFLYHGVAFSRRWMTRGQDFYPVWKRMWSGGGTSMTALAQLVRWCKGAPVLPLSTWRYWCSSNVALLDLECIKPIEAAGYPESVPCVLCGRLLGTGMALDWWHLDGVSGPCCSMRSGCGQKRNG